MNEVRRVTVITDAALKDDVVDSVLKLGANGFTSWPCDGKGEHKTIGSPFASGPGGVYIEFIVQPAVAETIVRHLHGPHYAQYAMTVYCQGVQVDAADKF